MSDRDDREFDRGSPVDHEEWLAAEEEAADDSPANPDVTGSVSPRDNDATLVSRFDHAGVDCELGRTDDTLWGFVRLPDRVDRLGLLWELDPPGEFAYGPDGDGWVGFDADRSVGERRAAMALAGLAKQVADRARSAPD